MYEFRYRAYTRFIETLDKDRKIKGILQIDTYMSSSQKDWDIMIDNSVFFTIYIIILSE